MTHTLEMWPALTQPPWRSLTSGSSAAIHSLRTVKGWPEDANQDGVLSWLADFSDKLMEFVESHGSISTHQHGRRSLTQLNKPIQGSLKGVRWASFSPRTRRLGRLAEPQVADLGAWRAEEQPAHRQGLDGPS
ncbi:hypothetical protein FOQG_16875 [Fusarium oxysporum f. sp. raphani 54005]|uniref:Uncharacterized protein n=2 Tax=Fusarium oxysporum TaxID=5507 RepID=X0BJ04_FUSOX|nr:hypothetical protein FOMG_17588 [Fusarium oxysporum f. sp. melonis 26406]EXK78449.1 hypothetical protein FOQG_16875 [Fusarium oxysporum f. sp. raphani 54005]